MLAHLGVTGDATPSDDLGDANGNLLSRLLFGICTLEKGNAETTIPIFSL
jgi:hypothetical protein